MKIIARNFKLPCDIHPFSLFSNRLWLVIPDPDFLCLSHSQALARAVCIGIKNDVGLFSRLFSCPVENVYIPRRCTMDYLFPLSYLSCVRIQIKKH